MLTFLLSKVGLKILAGIIVVLLVAGSYYYTYHVGYTHGVLTETVKYDKLIQEVNTKTNDLIERQDHNNSILDSYQTSLLNDLQSKNDELNKIVQENKNARFTEKDGSSIAVSASRSLRINRVR